MNLAFFVTAAPNCDTRNPSIGPPHTYLLFQICTTFIPMLFVQFSPNEPPYSRTLMWLPHASDLFDRGGANWTPTGTPSFAISASTAMPGRPLASPTFLQTRTGSMRGNSISSGKPRATCSTAQPVFLKERYRSAHDIGGVYEVRFSCNVSGHHFECSFVADI